MLASWRSGSRHSSYQDLSAVERLSLGFKCQASTQFLSNSEVDQQAAFLVGPCVTSCHAGGGMSVAAPFLAISNMNSLQTLVT